MIRGLVETIAEYTELVAEPQEKEIMKPRRK
jgi:hypothetical protein